MLACLFALACSLYNAFIHERRLDEGWPSFDRDRLHMLPVLAVGGSGHWGSLAVGAVVAVHSPLVSAGYLHEEEMRVMLKSMSYAICTLFVASMVALLCPVP